MSDTRHSSLSSVPVSAVEDQELVGEEDMATMRDLLVRVGQLEHRLQGLERDNNELRATNAELVARVDDVEREVVELRAENALLRCVYDGLLAMGGYAPVRPRYAVPCHVAAGPLA
jgi:predicted nuclease with TOPRIM domain